MTTEENVYDSLAETHEDGQWAFGTGFEDVHEEITAPVPDGVDAADLAQYCLMLGDDALICAQRLAEWVANAPELEEEVALANTALDLLGQARVLLARAAHLGAGADEDALAYLRGEAEFRNVALAEIGDDLDFARAIARLLVFSTWRLALHGTSARPRATRCWPPSRARASRSWPTTATTPRAGRSGSATAPTCRTRRCRPRSTAIWPYVDELFRTSEVEMRLPGVAVDPADTRADVDAVLDQVLAAATLDAAAEPGQRDDRRPRADGRACTPRRWATCSPRCRASPASTRGRRGERTGAARAAAATVVDPEMPMLTLDDLGVLRDVRVEGDGVTVTITPTYSGCPATRGDPRRPAPRAHRRGLPAGRGAHRAVAAVEHRLDHRGRPREARRGTASPRPNTSAPAAPGRSP